jgi:3'(2'), 5'-bisphosphate nucleotidase
MPLSHRALLAGLLPAAQRAAARQLEVRRWGIAAELKADQSPVTVADQDSEAMLLEALRRIAPGIPVIAEEATAAGIVPQAGATFFLVDPLDGTREYIAGGDDFTINVALVVDGVPRFGLVLAAASSWLFATVADGAAIEARGPSVLRAGDVAGLEASPIMTRALPAMGLVGIASRRHRHPAEDGFLSAIGAGQAVAIGSSLKFCLVARGEADVYPRAGRINEWDTAAGDAVLRAAGGVVLTANGQPLRYGKQADRFLNPPFVAWGRSPAGRLAGYRIVEDGA